jgi:UrcA family protein
MRIFKRTALGVLPVAAAMMADSCIAGRTAAHAAPGREPPSVIVNIKDLDLTTHAGTVSAYLRLRNAARSVCGTIDDIFPEVRAAWERCVDEAIASALARLQVASLTDYYLARAPHSAVLKRESAAESQLAAH